MNEFAAHRELKLLDGLGKRWLRDVAIFGSPSEIQETRHRNEITYLVQLHRSYVLAITHRSALLASNLVHVARLSRTMRAVDGASQPRLTRVHQAFPPRGSTDSMPSCRFRQGASPESLQS